MNLKQERRKHEIKLAIIEMIESCDYFIESEKMNVADFGWICAMENSKANIVRYENIKAYLLKRYKN